MKTVLLIITILAGASLGFADSPLYTITLKQTSSFEVASGGVVAVYPLSERAKPLIQQSRKRSIEAADYAIGTTIKTVEPKAAARDIVRQIEEQTALSLGAFSNSRLVEAEPAVILMAAGENSVWHVVLTPKEANVYLLTVSYLIDEAKKG